MGHMLCPQTCLAPEEFKNSRSGPWPKKVVHHCFSLRTERMSFSRSYVDPMQRFSTGRSRTPRGSPDSPDDLLGVGWDLRKFSNKAASVRISRFSISGAHVHWV